MDYHGNRIGHVSDAGAQGSAINSLKKFTGDDLIAYYDYQVKQLIANGGWRESVSWLTVAKTIGEWVNAGKPTEPLEKNRGQQNGHVVTGQVGKYDPSSEKQVEFNCGRCFDTKEILHFPKEGSMEGSGYIACPDCAKDKEQKAA